MNYQTLRMAGSNCGERINLGFIDFGSRIDEYHTIQIVTGIEVNSESYFPKLREYCPSAEGTRAIFPQLREIRLTIE